MQQSGGIYGIEYNPETRPLYAGTPGKESPRVWCGGVQYAVAWYGLICYDML